MENNNRMEIIGTAVHQITNCIDSVIYGNASWEDVENRVNNLICIYLCGYDIPVDDIKFSIKYIDGKLVISSKSKSVIKSIKALVNQVTNCSIETNDNDISSIGTAVVKKSVPIAVVTFGFDTALSILKMHRWVSRLAWCSDGHIRVVLQKGYPSGVSCNKQTAEAWGIQEGDIFKVEPYFQISTEDGSHVMWVPTTADCLAEDWYTI